MTNPEHQSLEQIITGSIVTGGTAMQDHFLWKLIEDSMLRGHQSSDLNELHKEKFTELTGSANSLTFGLPCLLFCKAIAGRMPPLKIPCSNGQPPESLAVRVVQMHQTFRPYNQLFPTVPHHRGDDESLRNSTSPPFLRAQKR